MEKKAESHLTQEKQQPRQLIVFRVSDEEFGIPIETVQEIIKVGMITPIPDSPAFVQGLINVRGDIVAVINLKERFFLSADDAIAKHIVIAKQTDSLFGLMVDEVIEVLRVHEDDIKDPPQLMSKIHEEYVRGVLTHEGRLIIVLDLSKALSESELIRLAETARAHDVMDIEDKAEKILDKGMLAQAVKTSERKKTHKEKRKNGAP